MKQKNMREANKRNNGIFVRFHYLVYTMIIVITIITSCEIPVIETSSVIAPEISVEPEIEVVIDPETPVINEEIIIMTMKPIKVYEKYAVDENCRVLGINGKELEPVFLVDTDDKGYQFNEFFTKDGTVFFSTIIMENGSEEIPDSDPVQFVKVPVTHYYFQTGTEITKDTKSAFPKKPISAFVEMGITPWSIVTFDYKGDDTSRVIKDIYEDGKLVKSLPTGFKMIDAYLVVDDDLWFSVPETIATRLKGIYFYPVDGNLSSSPVMSGRIW